MRTKLEILIAKLFNNSFGRVYLGVPQGKKIYKITKSSAHYYTGEIAKNGMPIICTGNCSPNSRLKFVHWLETWKPIHLCWLFLKMGWKIPKYFIGADTGNKSPTATGKFYNNFVNPTYAYVDDNQYATVTNTGGSAKTQSYESFGFEIPSGTTIDGIEVLVKHYESAAFDFLRAIVYSVSAGHIFYNKDLTNYIGSESETEEYVGGSTDKWGGTWISSDFSDANFSASVYCFNWTNTSTEYLNHIQVKVYYTLIGPFPTFFRT